MEAITTDINGKEIPIRNREAWLQNALVELSPLVNKASYGMPLVQVSCGWPATRPFSSKKRSVGECWHRDMVKQDAAHIFISPFLDDGLEVLGVLLHELGHAVLSAKTGHRSAFKRYCADVGLDGKPTATVIGATLEPQLKSVLKVIGDYPHQSIDKVTRKKQTTRLRLYMCSCDIKIRVAKDDLHATCEDCGDPFELRSNGNA